MINAMEPQDIKDRKSLKTWLKGRSREDAIVIAQRSALRVVPLWSGAMSESWARKLDLTALPILRQTLASGVAAVYSTPEVRAASAATSASAAYSAYSAAAASADSAAAATSADYSADYSATSAAARAARAAAAAAIWSEVSADASALGAGANPKTQRLWRDRPPAWFTAADARCRAIWAEDPGSWAFWTRWWDGVLSGNQLSWDLQRDVALIPKQDWAQGPEHVAGVIAGIEAGLAITATQNAELIEVNPTTGKLRLVPDTRLPDEIGAYVRRKLAKARALFPEELAQQHRAIAPELALLSETLSDASNLPVELFDTCASVSRRVIHRANSGECPGPDQDPIIADFLH